MARHKTDCNRIDYPLEKTHGGIAYDKDEQKIIFCTPRGDLRVLTRKFIASGKPGDFDSGDLNDDRKIPTQTHTIQQALQYAGAGCIIQLLPGKYYRAAEKARIRAS